MANYCSQCGAPLKEGAKFCENCGAPAQFTAPPAAPSPRTQAEPPQAYVAEQRQSCAPAQQQPGRAYVPTQPASYPPARTQETPKSAGGDRNKFIVSAVCLVLSAAILITGFWKPGFARKKTATAGDSGVGGIVSVGLTGGGNAEKTTVSVEEPTIKTESGVSLELSSFLFRYDEPLEVSVTTAGTETADNGDWRITAYDIEIGELHELDTFIEIRLPYDSSFCAPGENPAECVGAKYYNETTGAWEDVLYDVDAEHNEVVVYTDHLSRYGCFEVEKAGLRRAYITSIDDDIDIDVPLDKAAAAMANYASLGIEGESCIELGLVVLNRALAQATSDIGAVTDAHDLLINGYNGLQLGDFQFFSEEASSFQKSLGESLGNIGKIVGAVKLGAEILKSDKTSEDILGIYKDAGMYAMSYAEGALGTAMVGVWLIDKSLTDLAKEARNIRMENWETIYEYYNDKWADPVHGGAHRARTTAEWRDLVAKIVAVSHGDKETFKQLLEAQVDAYARRFFVSPPEEDIEEIQHIVDHIWRGALSASEKEELIAKYKQNLYHRLTSVILVEMQRDYQNRVKAELLEEMKALKADLNRETSVHIYEEVEQDAQPQLGNYQVRFSPLNSAANVRNWTGKMQENGECNTILSVIGWICAGQPDQIDFWPPDKNPDADKPEFSVPFHFEVPRCEVKVKVDLFPTLDEIAGFYENGVITITDVQYPSEEMRAALAEAGCDFDGMIGETSEFPFTIYKLSETTAILGAESMDDSGLNFADQGGAMTYDQKTGKFEPFVYNDEGGSYTLTMSAVYSDEQRSGVVLGCEMKLGYTGEEFFGLTITANIAGEKPLDNAS